MGQTTQTSTTGARRTASLRDQAGSDPGPGKDRRERGYFVASERTWRRIRIEYSAGASAAWLAAKYGPAERTLAARAKREGWRKKDVALRADADWDALEAEEAKLAAAREARVRAREKAGAAAEVDPGVDLGKAARTAVARALGALEAGDPKGAQEFLKLARMLEGDEEAAYRPSAQDEAALAYVLARLEAEER